MIVGLAIIIGSFLNVCIYRIPRQESIAFPGSHCPSCNTQLKPWDLIPIVSYLVSKGKCRYCGESISPQYPIVEGLNALLYLLIYHRMGISPYSISLMALSSVLIVIAMIDLEHQIIPDSLNLGIVVIAVTQMILVVGTSPISRIAGLIIGGGFFLLISVITNGSMGGGDIKLMGALGLVFGIKHILLIILLSFVLGSIISLGLMALKFVSRKDAIAFGPFISLAAYISIVYGSRLIEIYTRSLL